MDDMPNIEQLGKIINAVKTARALGDIMQSDTAPSVTSEQPSGRDISAFDKELQSPAISSIKAAIPYLDSRYQRNMGIIVKLMELDRLLHHYTVLATESGEDKSKQMLAAIKNELPENNKPIADLLMKIIEIKNITNVIKEMELN